jgi:biotin transport system ATP-binding protein
VSVVLDRASVRVAVEGRPEPKVLLDSVSLTLSERRIGVIGANGSGKSTLLRLLNGLVAPSSGTVTVLGADTVREVRSVRKRVGFVFTDPLSQLVMPTGREDVELSLRRSVRNPRERRARAEAVLDRFGLLGLADQSVYELSGGERQLVALSAVLAVSPDVLVLDEPSTLLDLRNRELLRRTLAGLDQQVILSTHDLDLALDLDRVLVVDEGKIVFDGAAPAAVAHYRALCAAAPGAGASAAAQPDSAQPGSALPGSAQPGSGHPDSGHPGSGAAARP